MMNLEKNGYRISSAVLFVAMGASACGGGGTGPANGSSGTSKAPTNNTAQNVPAKPVESSNTTKANTSATSQSGSESSASVFHVVADVDYELDMQRLGKSAVIVASGQLLPIRDNTVTFDPKFALNKEILGDGVSGAFQNLLGSFPDELFASVVRPSGRTGFTELYKWTGSKWASHYSTAETTFVLDVQPWQNGTALMAEMHSMSGELMFSVFPKGSKVFLPEPHDKKFKGVMFLCETGFIPDSLRTLPSGHVFMTGVTCTADGTADGKSAVKRWSPENAKGTVDVLPELDNKAFTMVNLAMSTDKDVFLGGNASGRGYGSSPQGTSPYLAHFDGKEWKRDTLPFSDGIKSLDVDTNGKLWIISESGAMYSRASGGTWTPVVLPRAGESEKPMTPVSVWVRGPGDEWIIGKYQSRFAVLHSGPRGEMAQLPDLETMEDKVTELAMPVPLTWRCMTPFVLLYTLSKVAPPDFDYPATREALKGHNEFEGARFIEFKRLDKRYMGAFVVDADMGKKLVELVKKKVPNSTPQLVCHAPKATRELEVDLSR